MHFTDYCNGQPLQFGTEPILLIDESTVEDRWGVRRVINRPIKDARNPLLMPDMPWEDGVGQPNVLYDEDAGLWRMWYTGIDWEASAHQFVTHDWKPEHGRVQFLCYAESDDGVHWQRPKLDGKSYKHHQRTNVVFAGREKCSAGRVTLNELNPEEGRFLLTYKDNLPNAKGALCLAYSDDGINWREDPNNPAFIRAADTWHNMVHDPQRNRWLMITRPKVFAGVPNTPGGPTEQNYKRRMAAMVGETPYNFGFPRVVLWPQETDDPDFDNFVVHRVGSHFVCFLASMSAPPNMEFNLHLAFSADGLNWNMLPDRPIYLPPPEAPGTSDAFDRGSISDAGALVTVGNTNYLYYLGATHGQAQSSQNKVKAIGRAQFLRDRFVAQMGAHTGGFLLTREMVVAAPRLIVNTTVADGYNSDPATATVPPEFGCEILQLTDDHWAPQPVPGYTLADCTTKPADLVGHQVTWKEKSDLAALVGKPVFIRFYLKNCGIYSLRFREAE